MSDTIAIAHVYAAAYQSHVVDRSQAQPQFAREMARGAAHDFIEFMNEPRPVMGSGGKG